MSLDTMSTGATPAHSPVAGVLGTSPTAKRPLTRDNVAMDEGGPTKPMSLEELTAGFTTSFASKNATRSGQAALHSRCTTTPSC